MSASGRRLPKATGPTWTTFGWVGLAEGGGASGMGAFLKGMRLIYAQAEGLPNARPEILGPKD